MTRVRGKNLLECELSVVVPCFRSPNGLTGMISEISRSLSLTDVRRFEIVLVADGVETAHHLDTLLAGHFESRHLRRVNLAENRGEQIALAAGIIESSGEYVVTLDDDGQHRPEDIPTFLEAVRGRDSLVYGQSSEKSHSFLKSLGSSATKKTLEWLGVKNAAKISSFRAFPGFPVRNLLRNTFDPGLSIDAVLVSLFPSVSQVRTKFRPRTEGRSGYNFFALTLHGVNLVMSSSLRPLRITLALGGLLVFLSSLLLGTVLIDSLFLKNGIPDWVTTGAALGLLASIQLVAVSVIGEYVARTFLQVRGVALYRKIAD